MNKLRLAIVPAVALSAALAVAMPVAADDISTDVIKNANGDSVVTLDLVNADANGLVSQTVTYTYTATNTNDANGCNLTGQSVLTYNVTAAAGGTGTAATPTPSTVSFNSCEAAPTTTFRASQVGSFTFTLTNPQLTGTAPKEGSNWDVSDAEVTVTVVDSRQTGSLDAPEIANDYLSNRADNSDCRDNLGSEKSKKANWHGRLLSAVAKNFQGQTFTASNRSVVEDYVEHACRTGNL